MLFDMIKILRSGNIRAPIDPAPAQGDQSAGNQKAYLSVPRKKPAGPIAEKPGAVYVLLYVALTHGLLV